MRGYLIPLGLVAVVAWVGKPAWWATAMLAGGAMYAWDYLWGDPRVLRGRYGLKLVGLGVFAIAVSLLLAQGLGAGLQEFQDYARTTSRRESFLYQLPGIGVGLAIYGLLVWSNAWARDRDG
jgi:uncharacterized membrane protein